MTVVVAAVIGYAIGMFPTALLVGRQIGRDPSSEGSGNPGASNVYRLAGRRAGLVVALGDVAKGAIPTAGALALWGRPEAHAAWIGAVAGHVWPMVRRFRGGKGAATAGGGGLVVAPLIGVVCGVIFAGVAGFTRIAAVGSLAIAIAFPAIVAAVGRPLWEVAMAAAVGAILVVRHHSNIRRLWRGEEWRLRRTGSG